MKNTMFILYVADQTASAEFYRKVLAIEPTVDVPGMTEFELPSDGLLGLMPEAGIKRMLGEALPDPAQASGIPRAELYMRVERPEVYFNRAIALGATLLSAIAPRSWGDSAGYLLDPDGHVLAFASIE